MIPEPLLKMIHDELRPLLDDRFWDLRVTADHAFERGPGGVLVRARVGRDRFYSFPITEHEARLMFESDGRGWDAYGIRGLDAMIMQVAMRAGGAKPHRIPELRSGWRLSDHGRLMCGHISYEFYGLSGLTKPTPAPGSPRSTGSSPRTP